MSNKPKYQKGYAIRHKPSGLYFKDLKPAEHKSSGLTYMKPEATNQLLKAQIFKSWGLAQSALDTINQPGVWAIDMMEIRVHRFNKNGYYET